MSSESSPLPPGQAIAARKLTWEYLWAYRRPLGLGILSLALVDAADILPPLIIKHSIDGLEKGEGVSFLLRMGIFYLLLSLVQAVFRFYWRKYFLGTSHVIIYDLRGRLYRHLQSLPFAFFNRSKVGELMSRLTNDLDEVRQMFGFGMLMMMDSLFYFLSVPLIMLYLSPTLSLYLVLPLPLIPFLVVKMGSMIHARSTKVQEQLAELSARAQESISGIRIIKGFRREDRVIGSFNKLSEDLVDQNLDLARVEAGFHPALEMGFEFAIFCLILFGGPRVLSGELTIGTFVAFQAYLMKMVWPMTAIGLCINLYQRGQACIGRAAELLAEAPGPHAAATTSGGDGGTPAGGPLPHPPVSGIWGDLEIRNLTFTYPGTTRPALQEISFQLPAGRVLGLVGPIGSGKTTLVHLLLRLYEPPPATTFLDGTDVCQWPLATLRGAVGYTPQDHFLFSESIRENIAFGFAGPGGDPATVERWAEIAQIDQEIRGLPHGFDTLLGERGVNLSGGQKQRVSLARALARDPRVLILDDCTSAVDTDTEERIVRGLGEVLRARTSIVISHRLVSVQHADLILYLEDGRIAERGTHAELLARGGRYRRMWEKQRLKAELGINGEGKKPTDPADDAPDDPAAPGGDA